MENFEIKNGTFRSSFAASCNTAFITQAGKLDDDDLTKQAQQVFGLGLNNWSTGVSSFDGAVPVQSNAQMASSLIGQGGVRMNPLNVASIISTAKTGIFRQPYLVSPDVDDRSLATAQRKLDASAQTQLHELLSYTATSGSAAEAMAGLGPDIGGKTGPAEVDGQKKPNGAGSPRGAATSPQRRWCNRAGAEANRRGRSWQRYSGPVPDARGDRRPVARVRPAA